MRPTQLLPILLALLVGSSAAAHAGSLTPEQRTQVREALIRLTRHPSPDWAYLVVADPRSNKFVQFGRPKRSVEFDFPIYRSLRSGATNPLRDASCTATPPLVGLDETVKRYRSAEEEQRIAAVLRALPMQSTKRYCQMLDTKGRRQGHNLSIVGSVRDIDQGVQLVDDIFTDAYLLPGIEQLEIEIGQ